jgi:hypothetical protein
MEIISQYLNGKTADGAAAIKAEKIALFLKSGALSVVLPYTFTDTDSGITITIKSVTYDSVKKVIVFPDLVATAGGKKIILNLPFGIYNPIISINTGTAAMPSMTENPIAGLKISLVRMVKRCMVGSP